MACGNNGLRALYKQSEECDKLMRQWHASNLMLWNHQTHMGRLCSVTFYGIKLTEEGLLPSHCSWCGQGCIDSYDRLKMLQQQEQKTRKAYQQKMKAEVAAWMDAQQIGMFTEGIDTWE